MPQLQQQQDKSSKDSWTSDPISCSGGLILNVDPLTLGTKAPGAALTLQNFECSIDGGYRRLSGYTPYDSNAVPGTTNNPVLGLCVALGGVFAVRKLTTDNRIYFSTGAGWGTKLNSSARTGSVTKVRGITYTLGANPVVVLCDGVNPAWKWDGTTETVLNGTDAPTNPKYSALFYSRLVLAGYGTGNKIRFAAPNTDTDFMAADGALETSVGDTIVGIATFRETLVIFCKKYIIQVTGDGSTNNPFVFNQVADSIGCFSGDSIQELGGDLIYLSADTLRSFAATARINDVELSSVCSQIQPLVRPLLQNGYTADEISSCCVRRKDQYRLFINDPNNVQANTIGLIGRLKDVQSTYFNPRNQYEWSTMLGIKPYCADSNYTNSVEISVIGDPTNGLVYQLESGNDFNGTPMLAIYRSPDITFDDATLRKVFQKITILGRVEGNFTTTLNLILERGDTLTTIQPNGIPLASMGSTAVYGTAVYDTDTYGQIATPVFKQNLIGSGFLGAFQFSSNDSNAPYTINAYQVQFSIKGRR